jgi:hypothetical protein
MTSPAAGAGAGLPPSDDERRHKVFVLEDGETWSAGNVSALFLTSAELEEVEGGTKKVRDLQAFPALAQQAVVLSKHEYDELVALKKQADDAFFSYTRRDVAHVYRAILHEQDGEEGYDASAGTEDVPDAVWKEFKAVVTDKGFAADWQDRIEFLLREYCGVGGTTTTS